MQKKIIIKMIWMTFLWPKYSQFPCKSVPRNWGGELCNVTVFDNIAVAGSRLVISLAHGFKCASDLLASNANF